ncbi:MAG TPA: hypothetical protein VFC78_04030 [Tepidisphaeraceae bacterium]|nr:hypothetical protein [Tepidisphaeraceae bacterium]
MTTAPPPSAADQPDWEQAAVEVLCPLCEYNLRGLTEPRCPECGYQFIWRELLDPARRVHPYLFEHKRGLAIKAFLKTAWMNLRPRRFWATLGPQQPSNPRRLIVYWIIVTCVAAAGVFGEFGVSEFRRYLELNSPASRTRYGFFTRPLTLQYRYHWHNLVPYVITAAVVVAWPWMTVLALMIFQISMRQAKVRPIHVLRCVLYASSVMLWMGLLLLAWDVNLAATLLAYGVGTTRPYANYGLLFAIPLEITFTWCLIVAFSRYLRFSHASATILCGQIIAILGIMTAFVLAIRIERWF